MIETTPRALGQTRPSWCPVAAKAGRDPCEVKYEIDIPIIGTEEVGIPVDRMTFDAMQSATQRLPDFLPQIYADLEPYVDDLLGRATDQVVRTAEYEAEYLADKLLDEQVMPRAEQMKENLLANIGIYVKEILVTVVAVGAASVIAVGVGAWWVNRREEIRDRGGR